MKQAVAIIALCAVAVAGSAILAAPGQGTARPSDMTPARVWVENRSKSEALPVTIEGLDDFAKPLRVEAIGVPAVSITPTTVVQAKVVRQPWDHRTVTVAAGQDVGVALMQAGGDGWE